MGHSFHLSLSFSLSLYFQVLIMESRGLDDEAICVNNRFLRGQKCSDRRFQWFCALNLVNLSFTWLPIRSSRSILSPSLSLSLSLSALGSDQKLRSDLYSWLIGSILILNLASLVCADQTLTAFTPPSDTHRSLAQLCKSRIICGLRDRFVGQTSYVVSVRSPAISQLISSNNRWCTIIIVVGWIVLIVWRLVFHPIRMP